MRQRAIRGLCRVLHPENETAEQPARVELG